MATDSDVPPFMAMYPPADITPAEFEEFVVEVFSSVGPYVDDVEVTLHEQVAGPDGCYDLDGVVRLRWGGLDFMVVVEAKYHRNPIKRELVQVLHSKVQSIGAHKGVLVTTAPFQRGALNYAKAHGIALVTVTEGRFTIETKAAEGSPVASRERARELFGVPTFVGHCYEQGEQRSSTAVTLVSTEHPDLIRERVLGLPAGE
jgi:Restriction endonuclease